MIREVRATIVALIAGMVVIAGLTMPANAAAPHTRTAATTVAKSAPDVTYHATPVRARGDAALHRAHGGTTSNVTTDWSWWTGGWTVKFNWAETRQMSRGFGYCTAIAVLASPSAVGAALAAACGVMWVLSDVYASQRRCMKAYVPVSLINPSFSSWGCPT